MEAVTLTKILKGNKLKDNFTVNATESYPYEDKFWRLNVVDTNVAPEGSTSDSDGRYNFIIYSEINLINALKLFQ